MYRINRGRRRLRALVHAVVYGYARPLFQTVSVSRFLSPTYAHTKLLHHSVESRESPRVRRECAPGTLCTVPGYRVREFGQLLYTVYGNRCQLLSCSQSGRHSIHSIISPHVQVRRIHCHHETISSVVTLTKKVSPGGARQIEEAMPIGLLLRFGFVLVCSWGRPGRRRSPGARSPL